MINKKYHKIIVFTFIILGISTYTFSQEKPKSIADYTRINRKQHHRANFNSMDVINSNRPGFSVSAYNVGKGNFQIEAGLIGYSELLGINGVNGSLKSLGLDFSLRYAINNKIEIFSDLSTNQKWHDILSSDTSFFSFSPISLGVSYRLNEGEGFVPTMAIRGNVSYFDEYDKATKTDFSLAFVTQHQLATNWVFITNWKADRIVTGTNLGAIIGITNTITSNWSWFVEYFGSYRSGELNNFANLGMAYLINDDIQLDLFGGTNIDINKTTYYLSLGISWRLDKNKSRRKYNSPKGSSRIDHSIYSRYKNRGVR